MLVERPHHAFGDDVAELLGTRSASVSKGSYSNWVTE